MDLKCEQCGESFARAATGSPARWCSKKCRNRAYYLSKYVPHPAPPRERKPKRRNRAYEYSYNRRPYVRERERERARIRWATDPEYRERQLARWRDPHADVVISAPYTGHRWLDMARKAVLGSNNLDDSAPWADDYHDDIGEAVLALLEGRDMKEAVKEYRRKEYVPRNLTIHMGDSKDDEEYEQRWFDKVMPVVESAEDTYFNQQYVETRFNDVSTSRRQMRHRTQQPSRRRMNNK